MARNPILDPKVLSKFSGLKEDVQAVSKRNSDTECSNELLIEMSFKEAPNSLLGPSWREFAASPY